MSTATSCCTTRCRRKRATRRRRRCGSISARAPTIRRRGTSPTTTASWCNISSIRPSRPTADRRASTKPSRNCGAPPICGRPPTASASTCRSATGFKFRGPDLHWDCSVKTPIPFGTQGILYLTDTPPSRARSRWCRAFSAGAKTGWRVCRPAPTRAGRICMRLARADRRPRRRSHHLAPGAAARRQPQPRHEAAPGAVHQYVSGALRRAGGVDLAGAFHRRRGAAASGR